MRSDTTVHARIGDLEATSGPSDWLAGLNPDDFEGDTLGARLVRAAASIGAVSLCFTSRYSIREEVFPEHCIVTGHLLSKCGLVQQ